MKYTKYIAITLLFGAMFLSCNKGKNVLNTNADTLAYVMGLNVGAVLMEMDSTLNVEAVCEAIRDTYNGTQKMTLTEARDFYLAEKTYFVHEKAKAYQEQYLMVVNRDLYKSQMVKVECSRRVQRILNGGGKQTMSDKSLDVELGAGDMLLFEL